MIKWTTELDNVIKESIAAGYTAREIGIKIGVTKNAVLGRARRMNLRSGRTEKDNVIRGKFKPRFRILKPTPLPEPEEAAKSVTMFHLTPQSCRYPVSGTGLDILFCNEKKMHGHSYCQKHYRVAYRPVLKVIK